MIVSSQDFKKERNYPTIWWINDIYVIAGVFTVLIDNGIK